MAEHNDTGKMGESMAVQWLQERGYEILATNWRHKHLEVDIVASKNNMLHFAEVKCRKTNTAGMPEENFSKAKMKNLVNASEEFLYRHPEWKRIQFDIIAITLQPHEIYLIEDVFDF